MIHDEVAQPARRHLGRVLPDFAAMPYSDDSVAEDLVDGDVTRTSSDGVIPPPPRSRARGGSVLAAAMLGLGEILEPEKTNVIIEQESDDPLKDADLDLTFDGLPSLDDP